MHADDLRGVAAVGARAGEHAATRRDRRDAAVRVGVDIVAGGGTGDGRRDDE